MADIQWEPVNVTPHSVPRGKPYARITPSSVTFNAVATGLIENIEDYPWAHLSVGTADGAPVMLAFRFVKEEVPGAFPARKQSKNHKGITFFSRELVKRYFSLSGVGFVIMQCEVEKLDGTTLSVQLPTEENIRESRVLGDLTRELESIGEEVGEFFNKL